MDTKFYHIEGRSLTHWGDYGDILQHGMTTHIGRVDDLLCLERTGPYLPPITFPFDIILSTPGRGLMETSAMTGFSFQAVHKARIVDLPWHEWDLTTDEPPVYPASGEPEDYILERAPSDLAAQMMGDVYELVVPATATIWRPTKIVGSFRDLAIKKNSWNGADIFRGEGYGGILVTERAKIWFDEHLGHYTTFEEFKVR